MRKFNRGLIAAVAAAFAVLAVTAVAAQAATTYTPTGTSVDFVASSFSIKNIEADQTWTCAQFGMGGPVPNAGTARAYGAAASALPTVTPDGCSHVLLGSTAVTPIGDWSLTITGDATGTSWPARLGNVSMSLGAPNCDFTISGVVNGRFDSSTQKFTPLTGPSGLALDGVAGTRPEACRFWGDTLDLLAGDTVAVSGSWANTGPALSISNP